MEFEKKKPVYIQIASYILKGIAKKKWKEGERIPSVRDLSLVIKVNPNTIVRSFNYLQAKEFIFNKSGLGYFVCKGIYEKAREAVKQDFIDTVIPQIAEMLELLNMSTEDFDKLLVKKLES